MVRFLDTVRIKEKRESLLLARRLLSHHIKNEFVIDKLETTQVSQSFKGQYYLLHLYDFRGISFEIVEFVSSKRKSIFSVVPSGIISNDLITAISRVLGVKIEEVEQLITLYKKTNTSK